jgi:hypothetical protein
MCTDTAAATEITNFAAAQWTAILIDDTDKPRTERDELILLSATYGPAITER